MLGPDHPETLATRHYLAHLQARAGDTAGAAAALEELLPDRVRVLGPDHPHTLTTRNYLAHLRCRGSSRGRLPVLHPDVSGGGDAPG